MRTAVVRTPIQDSGESSYTTNTIDQLYGERYADDLSEATGNQWYFNGNMMPEKQAELRPMNWGTQLRIIDTNGCEVI